MWMLPELFARAGVRTLDGSALPEVRITALADDSRVVAAGDCFVAIRGGGFDGHRFVEPAARAGAAAIVVDRDVAIPAGSVSVRVEDTREALARLASAYYGLRGDSNRTLRHNNSRSVQVKRFQRLLLFLACRCIRSVGRKRKNYQKRK